MIVIKTTIGRSLKYSFFATALIAALPCIATAQTIDTKPAEKPDQYIPVQTGPYKVTAGTSFSFRGSPLILSSLGTMVTTPAASTFVPSKTVFTVSSPYYVKPIDNMLVVKPDMSQYNMPVKHPTGFFAALMNDRADNSADLNASPSLSIAAPSAEMSAKLLGDFTDDLGPVKVGFSIAPTTFQMQVTVTLPNAKGADISLTDSEGKTLWTAKTTTDKLTRSLDVNDEGVYYLVVKQGKKGMVSKITNDR